MTAVQGVLSRVRLGAIYQALTGVTPRQTGPGRWRAPAKWRGGNHLTVAGDDATGTWYDHCDGIGGGVLDLVVRVRGGNRADALRWVADFSGVPLQEQPLSPADRAAWRERRCRLEKDLPPAQHWRRAALELCDAVLVDLKARLFDSASPEAFDAGEVRFFESFAARLRRLDDTGLVAEYRSWCERAPALSAGMVWAAEKRELAERRALARFIRNMEGEDEIDD